MFLLSKGPNVQLTQSRLSLKTSISASQESNWRQTQTLFLCLYRTSVKLNPNGNNNEKRFNTLLLLLYFCYMDSSWQGRWLTLLLLHHQKKNNMTAKILENPLNVKDENCSTRSNYIWVLQSLSSNWTQLCLWATQVCSPIGTSHIQKALPVIMIFLKPF